FPRCREVEGTLHGAREILVIQECARGFPMSLGRTIARGEGQKFVSIPRRAAFIAPRQGFSAVRANHIKKQHAGQREDYAGTEDRNPIGFQGLEADLREQIESAREKAELDKRSETPKSAR